MLINGHGRTAPTGMGRRPTAVAWLEGLLLAAVATSYPIAALLSANITEAEPVDGLRAWLLIASLGIFLVTITGSLIGDPSRAGVWVAGAALLFFSYGHVYEQVRGWSFLGLLVGRHRFLLVVFGVAFVLWGLALLRGEASRRRLAQVVLFSLVAALMQPGARLVSYAAPRQSAGASVAAGGLTVEQVQARPDVYYIVLDGYGRSDILLERFGLDNNDFLEGLRERGFFVADLAHANYSQTKLSLASSLGMTHLDQLAVDLGPDSYDVRPLEDLVWHGPVLESFRQLGYQIVSFESGYSLTRSGTADVWLAPDYGAVNERGGLLRGLALNGFESMLTETTLLRALLDLRVRQLVELQAGSASIAYRHHRARILFTVEQLSGIASWSGPQFVFAHVLSPHPPFVFSDRGEPIGEDRRFTISDLNCCTEDEYREGYRQQASFLSRIILAEIDQILAVSSTPPVIILQGDHGPGSLMSAGTGADVYRERMPILNAYLLPGGETELYPGITPINSFGIVLNHLFQTGYELSPDRAYFSPIGRPYDLHPVDPVVLAPTAD